MLDHLVGLLVRAFNAQVTGAKPLQVHEVSATELGAFFGLLRLEENKREVWVDVVRSPHTAWLAPVESLSRRQAVALGYMRMLAE